MVEQRLSVVTLGVGDFDRARVFCEAGPGWSVDGASVLEAGVGTGRVTAYYIDRVASAFCCDCSEHMIAFAQQHFANSAAKLTFELADNFDLPTLGSPVDIFIEGWSFSHGVVGSQNREELRVRTAALVRNATKNLKAGGTAIIVETMGTNTDGAPIGRPPSPRGRTHRHSGGSAAAVSKIFTKRLTKRAAGAPSTTS